jgi:hypothetical protein
MNTLARFLLASSVILSGIEHVSAQSGQKLREPIPDVSTVNADECRLCDSLAHAYLASGDTSMAIYYYQQYVDAHPEDIEHKNILLHQVRMYNRRQSFYLSDQ